MSSPAASVVLRGGRVLRHGGTRPELADILVGPDGRILAVGAGVTATGAGIVDLAGLLVVPGAIDMHQHLDKTRTARTLPNPDGTLGGAVAAFTRYAATMSREDIAARAHRTAEACLARGTVAIRTHANVDLEAGDRAVAALVALREALAGRLALQVVAFVTASAARAPVAEARARLEAALDAGADAVGGAPALAPEREPFLDMLFEVAARRDRPLDLHVDEHLDPRQRDVEQVIARTEALGRQGRVVVGHCSVLGALPAGAAAPILDGLARARIGVVTLPTANLFLQGRGAATLAPRGLTRVAELVAAGVAVACASDNIQDPFVPVGTGDMFEVARWTVLAAHLAAGGLTGAFHMATTVPAALIGLGGDHGIRPGARADLLITDADDAEDLVASGPPARAVLVGGRLVAGALAPAVTAAFTSERV